MVAPNLEEAADADADSDDDDDEEEGGGSKYKMLRKSTFSHAVKILLGHLLDALKDAEVVMKVLAKMPKPRLATLEDDDDAELHGESSSSSGGNSNNNSSIQVRKVRQEMLGERLAAVVQVMHPLCESRFSPGDAGTVVKVLTKLFKLSSTLVTQLSKISSRSIPPFVKGLLDQLAKLQVRYR